MLKHVPELPPNGEKKSAPGMIAVLLGQMNSWQLKDNSGKLLIYRYGFIVTNKLVPKEINYYTMWLLTPEQRKQWEVFQFICLNY